MIVNDDLARLGVVSNVGNGEDLLPFGVIDNCGRYSSCTNEIDNGEVQHGLQALSTGFSNIDVHEGLCGAITGVILTVNPYTF